jgi:archaellum component FlaC
LGDIRIPDQKKLIADAREQVEGISANYNMGLITQTNVTTKLLMYGLLQMLN